MDKKKKAAALKYDMEKDSAPKVVAKGRGVVAQKIVEAARKSGVPVVENSELAALLEGVDLDETIPVELYKAVAEILSFLYKTDDEYRRINK